MKAVKFVRVLSVAVTILCATTSGLQSQAPSDTTALAQSGARDGAEAAKSVSTGGWFAGGLASGLIGPWGLLIVVPTANGSTIAPRSVRSAKPDSTWVYAEAFDRAFVKRVRQKRRTAAFTGNLIISVPVVIFAAAFSDR